jgi:hypothetical protein
LHNIKDKLVEFGITCFTFSSVSLKTFRISLINDASAWIDVGEKYVEGIDSLENITNTIREELIDKENIL